VHERTRHWARLEKPLERTLIKISAVASSLDTLSVRAMIEALIAGQRNPKALADLAVGRLRAKRAELAQALDGRSGSAPRRAGPHPAGPDRRPDRPALLIRRSRLHRH